MGNQPSVEWIKRRRTWGKYGNLQFKLLFKFNFDGVTDCRRLRFASLPSSSASWQAICHRNRCDFFFLLLRALFFFHSTKIPRDKKKIREIKNETKLNRRVKKMKIKIKMMRDERTYWFFGSRLLLKFWSRCFIFIYRRTGSKRFKSSIYFTHHRSIDMTNSIYI